MKKKQSKKNLIKNKENKPAIKRQSPLKVIQEDVAGIDLGSESHFVAAPNPDKKGEILVREFGTFTSGLQECVNWLKECQVTSVAMEATGVYWMHFYTMLEEQGLEVVLANSRHVKNVKGKKTDVSDAEWLMQLHSYGLLEGAFIPESQVVQLRTYCRLREQSVSMAGQSIQRMQKALISMNLRLDNVLSDISGKTGITIIKAILAGERDTKALASYRDSRCKKSEEEIEESLKGCYREDQIFALGKALKEYEFHVESIRDCDKQIKEQLEKFEEKPSQMPPEKKKQDIKTRKRRSNSHPRSHEFHFDLRKELIRIAGVDLTALPAIGESTALTLISEVGVDMSKWPTAKHFSSWLKLCPNNQISGGKRLRKKPGSQQPNRAAVALRMAVSGLYREENETALGVFYRRKKSHKGAPMAITAAASKLAKMLYNTLKTGKPFEEPGVDAYMEQQKNRTLKSMKKTLAKWGYTLISKAPSELAEAFQS